MGDLESSPTAEEPVLESTEPNKGRKRLRKALLFGYLALVHVVALVGVASPASVNRLLVTTTGDPSRHDCYRKRVGDHVFQERTVPPGSVVLLGDSVMLQLDPTLVTSEPAFNLSIGGDTTVGLTWRLPQYTSVQSARAVVLGIGVNDLSHSDIDTIVDRYAGVLRQLPANVPVLVSMVLPVNESMIEQSNITRINGRRLDNQHVRDLNAKIADLVKGSPNRHVVDATAAMVDGNGNLQANLTKDGLHLTLEGCRVWAAALKPALDGLLAQAP